MCWQALKVLFIVFLFPWIAMASGEESFAVVQARVQGLEAKIRSAETEIQKLIQEKQASKNPERTSEIIREMLTVHKELEKNLKEYDQQRSLLKYRYPEKSATTLREYERIDLHSIEDMEKQMSLGASVNRTLKKVRSQYGTPEPAPQPSVKPGKVPAPGLVDPVILKK